MIHQGQDPNASDYDGRTALMLACMKGHKQLVQVRYSSDYRPVFLHPWSFAQHRACRLLCKAFLIWKLYKKTLQTTIQCLAKVA